MSAEPARPIYYRPAEVAAMLRCSEWWIKEQARQRRIPFSWIGGSYLFTPEHVAEIVRLFEVRPPNVEPVRRSGAVRSRRSTEPTGEPTARLHARPPRRTRDVQPKSTAA